MARAVGILALSALLLAPTAGAQAPTLPQVSPELGRVRTALDRYRDPIAAVHDGYFSTLVCVAFPRPGGQGQVAYPAGGMGVHFLNPGLIGPQLDTLRPQVLIYEPDGDRLRLAAAEWFVPTQVSRERPQLFGQPFDGPMEGHHPVMPAELHHWDLHVWLWKANPEGVFSPTNPSVRCPDRGYSMQEQAPRIVAP
ncbi:MAG: hypothetical protein ACREMF_09830 [Gemmatimonadales bacterium]